MIEKLTLKFSQLGWLLIIFGLVACGQSEPPTPTPAPPTATPLPVLTTIESDEEVRTFAIVPEESEAAYIVDEEFLEDMLAKYGIEAGRSDTVGTTQNIEGQLQLNLADLSAPLGNNRFTVNLATLTSNQSRRDEWIRENGPEFNNFSLAEFVATGVASAPATYTEGEEVQFQLMGDLTIREVTQPVTFDVTAKLEGDTLSGVATAQLLLTDFNIEPPSFVNTLTVKDEFEVRVTFTAKEQ